MRIGWSNRVVQLVNKKSGQGRAENEGAHNREKDD